jgi:hypothetical protein
MFPRAWLEEIQIHLVRAFFFNAFENFDLCSYWCRFAHIDCKRYFGTSQFGGGLFKNQYFVGSLSRLSIGTKFNSGQRAGACECEL